MSFSADWLALRADADADARDPALLARLVDWADGRAFSAVDLGGGSGAMVRALAPALPGARWHVLDDDDALLAEAARLANTQTRRVDLARDLEAVAAPRPDLIAASAVFDLVSSDWIERFATLAAGAGAAVYAALTYDGRESWAPPPPHEAEALAAFHADMRRDKGFGPALGPDAPEALARALGGVGYEVRAADSAWRLTAGRDAALIDALAEGAVEAVSSKLAPTALAAWLAGRRRAERVEIGHRDILALPSLSLSA